MRGFKEPVDRILVCGRIGILNKHRYFFRSGRETGEVEGHSSDECMAIRLG